MISDKEWLEYLEENKDGVPEARGDVESHEDWVEIGSNAKNRAKARVEFIYDRRQSLVDVAPDMLAMLKWIHAVTAAIQDGGPGYVGRDNALESKLRERLGKLIDKAEEALT